MTISWSYHQSLSPGATFGFITSVIQAGNNLVYIGPDDSGDFYSYDGTTLTNIGFEAWAQAQGGSWDANPDHGWDAAWFGNKLYIAANKNAQYGWGASIVEYNPTGPAFTEVKDFNVGDTYLWQHYFNARPAGSLKRFIASDDGRLLVTLGVGYIGAPPDSQEFYESTDGSTWTLTTIEADNSTPQMMLSKNDEIARNILALSGTEGDGGTLSRVIEYGTPDWDDLTGQDLTNQFLIGYLGGKSWFQELDGSDWTITKSSDWGVTTSTGTSGALGVTPSAKYWRVKNIAGTVPILGYVTVNRVFEYDTATGLFEFNQELTYPGPANPRGYIDCFYLGTDAYILTYGDYIFTGALPETAELRLLDMAADDDTLYITCNEGETLKLLVHDLRTLIYVRQLSAGAATYIECDDRERGIFPVMKPDKSLLFIRGRDGNDLQLQQSDDKGITLDDLSDGAWGSAKYATALLVDPLVPDDMVIVFDDDDIYRSVDTGESWEKTADAPVTQREAARHWIDETQLLLAGQSAGAGELHFTPNYGETVLDVSDAGIGLINHIELSL